MPSNPEGGFWPRGCWQGRGGQGVAKACQGLGDAGEQWQRGCHKKLGGEGKGDGAEGCGQGRDSQVAADWPRINSRVARRLF